MPTTNEQAGELTTKLLFVDYPHVTFGGAILAFALVCAIKTKKNAMKDAAHLAMYAATIFGATSMGVDALSRTNTELGAAGWSQIVAFFMLLGYAGPNTIEILVRMWRGEEDVPIPAPPRGATRDAPGPDELP